MKGEVVYYRLFDLGAAIDLDEVLLDALGDPPAVLFEGFVLPALPNPQGPVGPQVPQGSHFEGGAEDDGQGADPVQLDGDCEGQPA